MLRKSSLLFIFAFLCLLSVNLYSQTDEKQKTEHTEFQDSSLFELTFDTEPIVEQKAPYFALGGGYVGTFLFNNFDDLNDLMKKNGYDFDKFDSPMYTSGFSFFTAIGIVKNLRIGVTGQTKTINNEKSIVIGNQNYKLGFDYNTYFTGFSADYGIVLFKSFALLPGITLGYNSITLQAYQHKDKYNWSDFKTGADENNYLNKASGSFWYLQPALNIEYAVTPFLMVRLAGGYNFTFGSSWEMNNSAELKGVPSGLNNNGMTLQLGLFLGLFNY